MIKIIKALRDNFNLSLNDSKKLAEKLIENKKYIFKDLPLIRVIDLVTHSAEGMRCYDDINFIRMYFLTRRSMLSDKFIRNLETIKEELLKIKGE